MRLPPRWMRSGGCSKISCGQVSLPSAVRPTSLTLVWDTIQVVGNLKCNLGFGQRAILHSLSRIIKSFMRLSPMRRIGLGYAAWVWRHPLEQWRCPVGVDAVEMSCFDFASGAPASAALGNGAGSPGPPDSLRSLMGAIAKASLLQQKKQEMEARQQAQCEASPSGKAKDEAAWQGDMHAVHNSCDCCCELRKRVEHLEGVCEQMAGQIDRILTLLAAGRAGGG
jgi:hypothetical protein